MSWTDRPTGDLLAHVRMLDAHDQLIPVDLLAELESRGVSLSKLVDPEDDDGDFGDRLAFNFGDDGRLRGQDIYAGASTGRLA